MTQAQTPPQISAASTGAMVAIASLAAAGYALTLLAFYPGYLTRDAFYVYENAQEWSFGDWQSPLMAMIWRLVDPVAPGTGSIFLLTAGLYWHTFGLLGITLAHRSLWLGVAAVILALAPPAFMFLAMIWRDVLFGVVWLTAAVIAYAGSTCARRERWNAQAFALLLIALGILLRPNALLAAPMLFAHALWPIRFNWKHAALLFLPALAAGYALVQITYYEIIGAAREYPERSVMVFDLGGITHFSGQNQFPVAWTSEETALLASKCYDPERWDVYWTIKPCPFVMRRLETEGLFKGSPELPRAWIRAITTQPIAYLQHRATFMWRLLAGDNLTLAEHRLEDTHNVPLMNDPYFKIVLGWHEALRTSVLFRAGSWPLLAIVTFALAWRVRATPSGAFAIAVTSSAIVYVLAFFLVGVAAEFRYIYWCVLASLAGLPPAIAARRERDSGTTAAPA
jgi:hypothetical protein